MVWAVITADERSPLVLLELMPPITEILFWRAALKHFGSKSSPTLHFGSTMAFEFTRCKSNGFVWAILEVCIWKFWFVKVSASSRMETNSNDLVFRTFSMVFCIGDTRYLTRCMDIELFGRESNQRSNTQMLNLLYPIARCNVNWKFKNENEKTFSFDTFDNKVGS